jgi:H/ACA ribonucleoprotein complex subunit 1
VVKCTNEKIPYFNSPVYLENKEKIGKVDEIFGPITDFYLSVKVFHFFVAHQLTSFSKLDNNMKAESFAKDKKFFCDPAKLLPLSRFLPQPKRPAGKVAKSPGG